MKEEQLKEMSIEKLESSAKVHKSISYALGFMMLLLLCLSLYLIIGKGKTSMISLAMMPIAFLPILLINSKKVNSLNEEINARKQPN